MEKTKSKKRSISGFLLIDKPKGLTSSDLVLKVKKILNLQKVGHTGTLDRNASGLMILTLGNFTSFSSILLGKDKEYLCSIQPGISTNSGDPEGEIIEQREKSEIEQVFKQKKEEWKEDFFKIVEWKEQIPPKVSALKVGGKRQSDLFRKNIEFVDKIRKIEISDLDLKTFESQLIEFQLRVSSGTYIRKIVMDLSDRWKFPLVLKELRRLSIGDLNVLDTITLSELQEGKEPKIFGSEILKLPPVLVSTEEAKRILNGNMIRKENLPKSFLFLDPSEKIVAWAEKSEDSYLYKKVFSNPD